jgi:hypothetical protein
VSEANLSRADDTAEAIAARRVWPREETSTDALENLAAAYLQVRHDCAAYAMGHIQDWRTIETGIYSLSCVRRALDTRAGKRLLKRQPHLRHEIENGEATLRRALDEIEEACRRIEARRMDESKMDVA